MPVHHKIPDQNDVLPPRPNADTHKDWSHNPAYWGARKIDETLRVREPTGFWTGLPPAVGAPLSGLLLGTAAGGLWRAKQKYIDGDDTPKKWWQNPIYQGMAAGTALGLGSGILQHRQEKRTSHEKYAYSLNAVVDVIRRDVSIPPYQKEEMIRRLTKADQKTQRQLISALMAGTLTGAAAARYLGVGILGALAAGAAGGFLGRNLLQYNPIYV